ncbi:hypothetical protein CTI16_08545 [Prevotella intermedia]|uniref:Uncharacterized protein n=1 Tax=Prevotella intermedia TaxID=28131 RepID=A0AAJ3V8S9_PREIN|nr:hypothetical protein CUB95_08060 [Prevotella intermedia]PIK17081.1 hypothetical protein CTI16_08545 [Prevotella intermedia]
MLVKIILKKNDSFDFALRKRLFCEAKPTLLPCKTAAFGMQNNRFCKSLTTSELNNRYYCEIFLQLYYLISPYIIRCKRKKSK